MTQAQLELLTRDPAHHIALRGIHLSSRLTAMGQRTTVAQTFVNMEEQAVEAIYTFPLPEKAAVCGFEVVTSDRVLTGQVEEAEKAIELYDGAIRDGHGAYMLEARRPDVFTINVGNLKPGQAVTVRITYVSELEVTDGRIRLAFPTVVAPRYATATATDPLTAILDADALNPPHLLYVPYGLTMEVEVALGRPIKSLISPSHAITFRETGPEQYQVGLTAGITETNREIVLDIDLGCDAEPKVQVAVDQQGRHYLAVTFVPEFDTPAAAAPPSSEVIFVLDCSGSMEGTSIAQAKAALGLCLRHLSEGDRFNICRFGSRFEWLSPHPVAYTQDSLERALAYLDGVDADLGGTELHAPLEQALCGTPPRRGTETYRLPRQVIVLTDGQVSNEPAIVDLARRHRAGNRIFTFGIGPACSQYLVSGLAQATGGAAEFIAEGERIEEKVLRTFSRIASPAVTDVVVDWDGHQVEQVPLEMLPLFDGDALAILARTTDGRLPAKVTLKCRTASGPAQWSIPVPAASSDGTVLATLWARRRLQALEPTIDTDGGRQQCIALSRAYGVLCGLTSFVAIEHRSLQERTDGRPVVQRVPVTIPQGWHGVDDWRAELSQVARYLDALPRCSSKMLRLSSEERASEVSALLADRVPVEDCLAMTIEALAGETPLLRLLGLQQADGSFAPLDPSAERRWLEALKAAEAWLTQARGSGPLPDDRRWRVINTLAALWLLQTRHAPDTPLWLRAQRKAIRFLARELGVKEKDIRSLVTA